jgi:hypothetical protein
MDLRKLFIEAGTTSEDLLIEFAYQYFNTPMNEAISTSSSHYYTRGHQFIDMSDHVMNDRKGVKRIWWNDVTDPDFYNFANECLDILKDDRECDLNKKKSIVFPHYHDGNIGFYSKDENVGWVAALRESEDKLRTLDSFLVATAFNRLAGNMRPNEPMFLKPESTYIVQLQKFISSEEKNRIQGLIKQLDNEINELTYSIEYATLELDEFSGKELDNKRKQLKKNTDMLANKTNQKKRLEASILRESYTITDKTTQKKLTILII